MGYDDIYSKKVAGVVMRLLCVLPFSLHTSETHCGREVMVPGDLMMTSSLFNPTGLLL